MTLRRGGPKPPPRQAPSSREAVLLDTGFLVALFDRRERLHDAAAAWLASYSMPLWSVPSVLVEAAHFLPGHLRPTLARAAASGVVHVMAPDIDAYGRIAALLGKYADHDPDWADIELVWLAEACGIHRIATLERADFGVYRIHGRRAFDIVWPA